jgi:hypothetical protein
MTSWGWFFVILCAAIVIGLLGCALADRGNTNDDDTYK